MLPAPSSRKRKRSASDGSLDRVAATHTSRATLLSLPLEVRLQIYHYLFNQTRAAYRASSNCTVFGEYNWELLVPEKDLPYCHKHHHGLLQACKQVRSEALDIYHQNVGFRLIRWPPGAGTRSPVLKGQSQDQLFLKHPTRFTRAIVRVELCAFNPLTIRHLPRLPNAVDIVISGIRIDPVHLLLSEKELNAEQLYARLTEHGTLTRMRQVMARDGLVRAVQINDIMTNTFTHPRARIRFNSHAQIAIAEPKVPEDGSALTLSAVWFGVSPDPTVCWARCSDIA